MWSGKNHSVGVQKYQTFNMLWMDSNFHLSCACRTMISQMMARQRMTILVICRMPKKEVLSSEILTVWRLAKWFGLNCVNRMAGLARVKRNRRGNPDSQSAFCSMYFTNGDGGSFRKLWHDESVPDHFQTEHGISG